jgi:membrane-bound serine protease (ClpP class)
MERKATNDAIAYLRALAELRGRDVAFAEAAVRDAATLSADQAVAKHAVDFIARDIDRVAAQCGWPHRAHARRQRHAPRGRRPGHARRAGLAQSAARGHHRAHRRLPAVAGRPVRIDVRGVSTPACCSPVSSAASACCSRCMRCKVLPVNYAGLALIVLGVGLMAGEFAMPSFGSLGIGGVAALVVGSLILFDPRSPEFEVPGN